MASLDGDHPERRNPLVVVILTALGDIGAGLRYHELWIHQGWVSVVGQYRRTWLGPLWHTLSLAAFICVMGVIWSKMLGTDMVAYFKHVTTGLIVWTLISGGITGAPSVFLVNKNTVLSIRFPYSAFIFAHVWRQLLVFGHHLLVWVILVATVGPPLTVDTLFVVPGIALILVNLFWLSLLLATLAQRLPDIGAAIGPVMQIMLFGTPVLWKPDLLGPELQRIAELNPLYHLLQIVRLPLLGEAPLETSWFFAAGLAAVGGLITLFIFGAVRDRIVYWY